METWFRVLLLSTVAACSSGCAVLGGGGGDEAGGGDGDRRALSAAVDPEPIGAGEGYELVYEPDVETREVREARIDTENFEIGPYGGIMNVQDFGVSAVYGLRAAYHVTQALYAEATYGRTEVGLTSFEELSGAAELLEPDERQLSYYNLSFGLNIFPGEVFLGRQRAFNSALYLTAGAGSTEFAGNSRFTVTVGLGYRFYVKDWLALHGTVRDHIFDIDLLGEPETSHNIESHAGFTVFF